MTANLADRVEGLDEPCRETDGDVAVALGLPPSDVDRCSWRRGFWYRQIAQDDFDTWDAPAFTASLDAVVALIEKELPGGSWIACRGRTRPDEPLGAAHIFSDEAGDDCIGKAEAATPALALLAAFLRAMENDNG